MSPENQEHEGGEQSGSSLPMTQAELDALLAGVGESASSAPPSNAAPVQGAASPVEPPVVEASTSDSMTQAELDALLAGVGESASSAPPSNAAPVQGAASPVEPPVVEASTSDSMTQAELDALLAGVGESASSAPPSNAAPVQGAASPVEPPVVEAPVSDSMTQAELDALLAGIGDSASSAAVSNVAPVQGTASPVEPPVVEASTSDSMTQAELDALLAGIDDSASSAAVSNVAPVQGAASPVEPPVVEASTSDSMTQAELDALLAGIDDSVSSATVSNAAPARVATSPAEPPVIDAPEPDSLSLEDIESSASGLDHLLGSDADQPLVHNGLDDVLPAGAAAADSDATVGQAEIDDLLASLLDATSPAAPSPPVSTPDSVDDDSAITQDILDALINASAEAEPGTPTIPNENLAAAVPQGESDDSMISQDILDALTREAEAFSSPAAAAPPPEPVVEAPPVASVPAPEAPAPSAPASVEPEPSADEPAPVRIRRQSSRPATSLLKVVSSLAAGIVCAVGAYVYLIRHQEVTPAMVAAPAETKTVDLKEAMEEASAKMKGEKFSDALAGLETAMAASPGSPDLTDAQYLRAEIKMRELGVMPGMEAPKPAVETPAGEGEAKPKEAAEPVQHNGKAMDELQGDLDRLVHQAPDHPKVLQALLWKAHLNDLQQNPIEARRLYTELLEKFSAPPDLDKILLDAAKVSLELRLGSEASGLLSRLLRETPGSPLAAEAHILLGDAYAQTGDIKSAKTEYNRIIQTQPDTALGAEAFARMGQLAFDEGDYLGAIQQLEGRLSSATTVQGNEPVYLMLARSYKAAGKLKEAERVLRELLDFFEPSDITPAAFVLLCEVLDAEGQRDEAIRLAGQTVTRYPDNSMALASQGRLLGEAGDYAGAAHALAAADAAGAEDPDVLLAAGKYFHLAQQYSDAKTALEKLQEEYGGQPQAFEGNIELAKTQYDMGKIRDGLQRLEDLATATEGKPQRLPVLLMLGTMYQDLGLATRAASVLKEASFLTGEPEVLARASTALFGAGNWPDGLALAARVDASKLKGKPAYEFLSQYGEVLLRTDSSKAIEKMEQAYTAFPEERTEHGDQKLLEAYLTTDRSARARAVVMDLDALARRKPVERRRLERAANTWGDYLYARRDYRAAADAYALAENGADAASPSAQWAAYQRANALRQLADFPASVAIYDKLAAGENEWKDGARAKSEYIKLEQRLRDNPLALASGTENAP